MTFGQRFKNDTELALKFYNEVKGTQFTLDSEDEDLAREMPLIMADLQYIRENISNRSENSPKKSIGFINEIETKTQCTREQAEYLAREVEKLPKVKDIFVKNLNNINLYGCDKVELVRMMGYMNDAVNIIGKRIDKKFSDGYTLYKNHKYSIDVLFPDKLFYDIY